ncbi:hypothetical protein [Iodidimonas sp. SYSU 1G8]|uniref:hypothetical protein n=1 Tax=Iodidimonas sp. SYSU 1G8 TaxID=3133967 RepID=UPI0031FEDDCF
MNNLRMGLLAAAGAVASMMIAGGAVAAEDKLSQWQPTGEKRQCIATYMIRETDILDNQTILFRLNGGDYYVNRLPHRCSGLKIQDGFGYTLRGLNELCNVDTITPVGGAAVNTPCPLGDFEKVVKRDAPAQ